MRFIGNYLTAFIFFLLLGACGNPEPASTSTQQTDNAGQTEAAPQKEAPQKEPPFVKEGELSFLSADGRKTLHKIDIEIAEQPDEREQGLMYRTSMANTQGMLFVFETLEPQAFWMHNTYIPLDIIYIDDKYQIVSIQKNCAIRNDTSLPSGKPAQYVVEVNGGLCDKMGIQAGARIAWTDLAKGQEFGKLVL